MKVPFDFNDEHILLKNIRDNKEYREKYDNRVPEYKSPILSMDTERVYFFNMFGYTCTTYQRLFDNCEFTDGSICGKEK